MMRVAAFAAVAVVVTACGGGSSSPQMVIIPPLVEPPSTVAAAAAPANTAAVVVPNNNNGRVRAEIESADEPPHYFKTPVSQPGTLTLTTTGVDTRIRAYTIGGEPIEGTPGSLTVTITPEIAADGAIVTEISAAPASGPTGNTGIYTLSARFTTGTSGTTTPPT